MSWKKNLYLSHRWLGLVVSLQLLAWSVGGFTFSILDIDNVHGDLERNLEAPPAVRFDRVRISPRDAVAKAREAGFRENNVTRLSLRDRLGRTVYELHKGDGQPLVAVDAESGEVILRITEAEAARAASADFSPQASVASVRYLDGDAPSEYRGKPMPVYQVTLNHPKEPHLYISPVTGDVLARRNKPWRVFDFFWMLHIMDYGERDSFNHWLLTTASAIAVLTSASGLLLWTFRIPRRRRAA
jgi:uncharacterized iron-regulated membrane protein